MTARSRALALWGAAALLAAPALAEGEFAEGSQVSGWDNLQGRENATFRAKVVDVVCALTGDCPQDCGGGARQMALLRAADGVLVLAAKNAEPLFTGATVDLAPYCGQTVTVDGLLVGDPKLTETKVYQVFLIQRDGHDARARAERWSRVWKRANKEGAKSGGEWFRHDPAVRRAIEANGYLGLGPEADRAFIEENY
jgi:hypothetical protein